jgi:predicted small metal-binding protein
MAEHTCPECGTTLTADDDEELFTIAVRHFRDEHPDATAL